MHFPVPLLALLSLLAPTVYAALVPKAPQSSIQGNQAAKHALQKRQARSQDVVRRLKRGPNRKRADPSLLSCSQVVGTNLISNGDFEASSSDPAPWVYSQTGPPGNFVNMNPYAGYAGPHQTNNGYAVQQYGPNVGTLAQTPVALCPGYPYLFEFDHGAYISSNPPCQVKVTLSGNGFPDFVLYDGSPCTLPGDCPTDNSIYAYGHVTNDAFVAPAGATSATISAIFDCSGIGQEQYGRTYAVDNFVFARKATV